MSGVTSDFRVKCSILKSPAESAATEVDWDGKVIWEWGDKAPGGAANQNHDWYRLPNGNTLLIAGLPHAVEGFSAPRIQDQAIYEVSPAGEIVWKWVTSEHLEEFGFSAQGLDEIRKGSTEGGGVISGFYGYRTAMR